ncbi:hypothetical protein BJ944DRAFT_227091 [Cunninghamella echinulata]|nr:hypothetical protein BJ944DRAFT_227091 [Cunninghamella echinulata]
MYILFFKKKKDTQEKGLYARPTIFFTKLNNKRVVRLSTLPNDNIDPHGLQIEKVDYKEDGGGGCLFEKKKMDGNRVIDISPDQFSIFDGMARRDFYIKQSFYINYNEAQESTIRIIMNINIHYGMIKECSQLSLFIRKKLLEYDFYCDVGNQGGMEQVFCYLARKARFSRQDYNEENDIMTSPFFYHIIKKVLLRRSKDFRLGVDDINKKFLTIVFVVTLFRLNHLGKAAGTISKQLEDNEINDWFKYYQDFKSKVLDWDQIIQSVKDNIDTKDTSRSGVYALFEN